MNERLQKLQAENEAQRACINELKNMAFTATHAVEKVSSDIFKRLRADESCDVDRRTEAARQLHGQTAEGERVDVVVYDAVRGLDGGCSLC